MASIQKIFLLSCCTLLAISYASSEKPLFYETHDGKTTIFDPDSGDTAEIESHPPTTLKTISTSQTAKSKLSTTKSNQSLYNATTLKTIRTSQTTKSKLSATKSNQSPNPMNSEEPIKEVNNNGGKNSSVQHFQMEGDEEHFSSALLPDTLINTNTTTTFTNESSKISNSRNIRQVGNGSVQNNNLESNIAKTISITSINSTTTKPESNTTTGVTNSTSVTNEPTLLPNKVTIKPTNVSTSATKSRKKIWTSFKYTVAGAVGVVGVFLWAYYIING